MRSARTKGFTLIEVIVTLLLVGITAVLAGMWIVSIMNGYVFAKENASNLQKGQLAMTRLTKELTSIQSVNAGASNGTQITYTRTDASGAAVTSTISRTGNLLQLSGFTLTDAVSAFSLTYCNDDMTTPACSTTWTPGSSKIITVTFTLTGLGSNIPSIFTKRIAPRNL